jgi:hypothetical protein
MIPSADTPAADSPALPAVYVYGVVRGALPGAVDASGVGTPPAPVRTVERAGLAAVVSDVPGDWQGRGREDVEVHDRVLARLIEHTSAVPLRFGTVMPSEAEAGELLERHAGVLNDLLDRIDGRVQMSVKAYYVEDALLREVLKRHPSLKRRSDALKGRPAEATHSERIALGREVAAAVEEQRAIDQEQLLAPLADVADALVVDAPASERQALSVQILVGERRRRRLDAAVRRLSQAQSARFAFRYVGPVPPYSFCDVVLGEE